MFDLNLKRVVITGPESSGKTTLARHLAANFGTVWAPEYARDYLSLLNLPYRESDLVHIAEGQWLWERYAGFLALQINQRPPLLFCDTSLEVIKIWSDYRFGRTHPWIEDQICREMPALYLLCRPDLPWEFDPLRENPGEREELFQLYEYELQRMEARYVVISGLDPIFRVAQAGAAVGKLLRE